MGETKGEEHSELMVKSFLSSLFIYTYFFIIRKQTFVWVHLQTLLLCFRFIFFVQYDICFRNFFLFS